MGEILKQRKGRKNENKKDTRKKNEMKSQKKTKNLIRTKKIQKKKTDERFLI